MGLFVIPVVYVIYSSLLMMVFKKAGVESWKAWVPFYNNWIFFELSGYKGWASLAFVAAWALPMLGGFASLIALAIFVIVTLNFQRAFGKDWPWILLYVFANPIWLAILAFDSSTYDKSKLEPAVIKELGLKN